VDNVENMVNTYNYWPCTVDKIVGTVYNL